MCCLFGAGFVGSPLVNRKMSRCFILYIMIDPLAGSRSFGSSLVKTTDRLSRTMEQSPLSMCFVTTSLLWVQPMPVWVCFSLNLSSAVSRKVNSVGKWIQSQWGKCNQRVRERSWIDLLLTQKTRSSLFVVPLRPSWWNQLCLHGTVSAY